MSIMSPEEARTAVEKGIAGIVVSDYGGLLVSGLAAPVEVLPSIAEAVGGKVPILIDGGFRRGTDALMALALGARAILLARPPMWGLAGYGADGVGTLLKLLQTELARDMAMRQGQGGGHRPRPGGHSPALIASREYPLIVAGGLAFGDDGYLHVVGVADNSMDEVAPDESLPGGILRPHHE